MVKPRSWPKNWWKLVGCFHQCIIVVFACKGCRLKRLEQLDPSVFSLLKPDAAAEAEKLDEDVPSVKSEIVENSRTSPKQNSRNSCKDESPEANNDTPMTPKKRPSCPRGIRSKTSDQKGEKRRPGRQPHKVIYDGWDREYAIFPQKWSHEIFD